jgi:hypothetical protein
MDTPTRRDFLTCAVGTTLASALPVSAQTPKDARLMPLVVDLIGPMAFRKVKSKQVVEVLLPKLDQAGTEHEAGIGTPVTSIELSKGDYTIAGTPPDSGDPMPYLTSNCKVYQVKPPDNYSAANRYILLTLPMPHYIVALDPVSTEIYKTGSNPTGVWTLYAVGFRFLYDHAGVPTLTPPGRDIPFEPAPGEILLNMSIGYAPYNYDKSHAEAKAAFQALSLLVPNLDLQVEFELPLTAESSPKSNDPKLIRELHHGPLHNCKAPVILLN